MKTRFVMLFFALISVLILPACNPRLSPTETHSTLQRAIAPEVASGDVEQLAAGNTAFALDLYQTLKGQDGNLFYSPFSISLALAMPYAGARGNTETQMGQVLHFTLPQDRLHPAFNALDLALTNKVNGEDDDFDLNITNSIWGQQGYPFLQTFLDTLSLNYGAGMRMADFENNPEPSRQEINQWVSDQTKERIPELIPQGAITVDARLVLVNAIYFNAKWQFPFDSNLTQDGSFTLLDGSQSTVPMMRFHEEKQLLYTDGEGYRAIALPYIGNTATMLIVLPDSGTFANFERGFDVAQLETLKSNLHPMPVLLTMPKFSFSNTFSLSDALANMGMTDAFTHGIANFSGQNGSKDLYISAIFHQAFVAVDELGTEAAGATAVIEMLEGQSVDLITMTIDHPFLFFIQDSETGTILFAGRVVAPETGG